MTFNGAVLKAGKAMTGGEGPAPRRSAKGNAVIQASCNDAAVARRLIMWDLDGTLVSSGPPGRLALETAAGVVAGLQAVPRVTMSGKTDPQIIAEMLAIAGVASEEVSPHDARGP